MPKLRSSLLNAMPVGQARPDQLRQPFRQRAEARLALAQRLLGPLAVGDVDRAAHETNRLAPGAAHGHAP